MNFEQFFDTTFDDQTLNLSKGDLKVAIKTIAEAAYYEGNRAAWVEAEAQISR